MYGCLCVASADLQDWYFTLVFALVPLKMFQVDIYNVLIKVPFIIHGQMALPFQE